MQIFLAIVAGTAILGVTNPGVTYGQSCEPVETAKFLDQDGEPADYFGRAVAISGGTVVVGVPGYGVVGDHSNTAFVGRHNGSRWVFEAQLPPGGEKGEGEFGCAVAISGDTIVVGADHDSYGGWLSGSASVFRYDGTEWVEEAKLGSSDLAKSDHFGIAVAVWGDTVVIGATWNNDFGDRTGSAYIFRFDGTDWVEEAKLLASDAREWMRFGNAVAIEGNTALIGAPYSVVDGESTGAVYVFEYNGTTWTEVAKLRASDGIAGDAFGYSVSISGNTALFGAYQDRFGPGKGYVFRHDGADWVEEAILVPADGVIDDRIARTVAISGNTAVMGAEADDDDGDYSGSAYVFRYGGEGWVEAAKLTASDALEHDFFGSSVAVSGSTLVIGALSSRNNGSGSGAAYVFELGCECLDLRVENLVAGEEAEFTVTGGTPGARGVTVYGTQAGRTLVSDFAGYCATFGIKGLNQSKVLGGLNRAFDLNGEIDFGVNIPGNVAGLRVFFQSAEHGTCRDECMSNLVDTIVQ